MDEHCYYDNELRLRVAIYEFMLKLFFNRKSPIVRAMEILGVVALGIFFRHGGWQAWPLAPRIALCWFLALIVFLRICATVRWYPPHKRPEPLCDCGIETHFRKVYVSGAYLLGIVGCWLAFGWSPRILYYVDAVLLVFAHPHLILLYLHYKDTSLSPVNELSQSLSVTRNYRKA